MKVFKFLNLTSSAEQRFLGSNASKRSSKRRANGSALGNFCEKGTRGFFAMLFMYRLAFSFRICRYIKNQILETKSTAEVENMQNTEIRATHYPKFELNFFFWVLRRTGIYKVKTVVKTDYRKKQKKRTNPCNGFRGRSAKQISHEIQLLHHILPRKQRFSCKHFCKNTSYAPDINSRGVLKHMKLIKTVTRYIKVRHP